MRISEQGLTNDCSNPFCALHKLLEYRDKQAKTKNINHLSSGNTALIVFFVDHICSSEDYLLQVEAR